MSRVGTIVSSATNIVYSTPRAMAPEGETTTSTSPVKSASVHGTLPTSYVTNPYLDPEIGHDNCAVGMLVSLDRTQTHEMVERALDSMEALSHRTGFDANGVGDGAGVALEIPRKFLARKLGVSEIKQGDVGVAMVFLPQEASEAEACRELIRSKFAERGFNDPKNLVVRTNPKAIPIEANPPRVEQFVVWKPEGYSDQEFEKLLYQIEQEINAAKKHPDFHIASLSSQGVIYKGMLRPHEVRTFYLDLSDADFESSLAMFHGRYSTNTVPKWGYAHPCPGFNCHNGEVNTLKGCQVHADTVTLRDMTKGTSQAQARILKGGSDSQQWGAFFRHYTVVGERSAPIAVTRMMPPSRSDAKLKGEERLKIHEYLATEGPAWQGPALMVWMAQGKVGVTLDSCGLRPASLVEGVDSRGQRFIYIGSQPLFEGDEVLSRGDLEPGQTFMVDLNEIAGDLQERKVYTPDAFEELLVREANDFFPDIKIREVPSAEELKDLQTVADPPLEDSLTFSQVMTAAGQIQEFLDVVIGTMAETGNEIVVSMGEDTVPWMMSDTPAQFSDAFRQMFAQVTNPPLDPIRDEFRFDATVNLGQDHSPLEPWGDHPPDILKTSKPVFTERQADWVCNNSGLPSATLNAVFAVDGGPDALKNALQTLCNQVEAFVTGKVDGEEKTIIRLTDKGVDRKHAAIPMVMAVGAVNQRLKEIGKRLDVKIIMESAEFYDTHTAALAFGYGATAICPYGALNALPSLHTDYKRKADKLFAEKKIDRVLTLEAFKLNYIAAMVKGTMKILSKMGITDLRSYAGAQVFNAPGISTEVLNVMGPGTPNPLAGEKGIDFEDIQDNAKQLHEKGRKWNDRRLPSDNVIKAKPSGKVHHDWNRASVKAIHEAVKTAKGIVAEKDQLTQRRHSLTVIGNIAAQHPPSAPADLLRFAKVPLPKITPAPQTLESIYQSTFRGADISYGSISGVAHRYLARELNNLGIPNGSGEGGIGSDRFGTPEGTAINQIAAGRFGVTSRYLNDSNVVELIIKMAQGAKPGEGGQLPGKKNTPAIASVRMVTPGISLISPPPQHDIYSIEDLAVLITTLKASNPRARVAVKLVDEVGIETIAYGCVKAGADTLYICSGSGGTGATPLTSRRRAGEFWESGISKTHQLLVKAGIRDQVHLVADGGIKSGEDIVKALLLGADSVSLGTYLLVAALNCEKCDQCHQDTCPVGIATQNEELIKKLEKFLTENPESVRIAIELLAQEVQDIAMHKLGGLTTEEMVGRTDLLEQVEATGNSRADKLDLSAILVPPMQNIGQGNKRRNQIRDIDAAIVVDQEIAKRMGNVLARGNGARRLSFTVRPHNIVGPHLAGLITRQLQQVENFGANGIDGGGVTVDFTGNAGPNFGALSVPGMKFNLKGAAPDGFGAMNNGGFLVVQPPDNAMYAEKRHVIIHNAALYGMTRGIALIRGRAGTRFAVRFSGGAAAVEGFGPSGAQYMTGGAIGVYGDVGHNLGAGMTGGILFVHAPQGSEALAKKCSKDVKVSSMTAEEQKYFKGLTQLYYNETKSPKAKAMLDNWDVAIQEVYAVHPVNGRVGELPDLKETIAAERQKTLNIWRPREFEPSGKTPKAQTYLTKEEIHGALVGRSPQRRRTTVTVRSDRNHHHSPYRRPFDRRS